MRWMVRLFNRGRYWWLREHHNDVELRVKTLEGRGPIGPRGPLCSLDPSWSSLTSLQQELERLEQKLHQAERLVA
jgi:hypothetical protein